MPQEHCPSQFPRNQSDLQNCFFSPTKTLFTIINEIKEAKTSKHERDAALWCSVTAGLNMTSTHSPKCHSINVTCTPLRTPSYPGKLGELRKVTHWPHLSELQFVSEAPNELQNGLLPPANSTIWPPLQRARNKNLKLCSTYRLHK